MIDKEARFRSVLDSNKDAIYRLCSCYVMDKDARQDVYQEVLVHLWKSLESFEGRSQLSTWVYRVTVNTCLGYLRAKKRRERVFDDNAGVEADEIPDMSTGSEQTETDVAHLYVCIGLLDPVDRALISLFLEDVSTKEIAEILGISEVNVRVKLHRVKKNLKDIWERTDHGHK
jgi:RNA polymerase sigma-70 factor (ECF subfamily)